MWQRVRPRARTLRDPRMPSAYLVRGAFPTISFSLFVVTCGGDSHCPADWSLLLRLQMWLPLLVLPFLPFAVWLPLCVTHKLWSGIKLMQWSLCRETAFCCFTALRDHWRISGFVLLLAEDWHAVAGREVGTTRELGTPDSFLLLLLCPFNFLGPMDCEEWCRWVDP